MLCETRTALVLTWDVAPEIERTRERRERYMRAAASHREHRRRDRDQVVRHIRSLRRTVPTGGPRDRELEALEAVVKAIDEEKLVRDRAILPEV